MPGIEKKYLSEFFENLLISSVENKKMEDGRVVVVSVHAGERGHRKWKKLLFDRTFY